MCDVTPDCALDLPADLSVGRRVRRFLRESLCPEHGSTVLDRALLVASELVVNAVEHGAPPVRAKLDCRGDVLRLEVSDGCHRTPRHLSPDADTAAEGGRGIGLVAVVCRDWGVRTGESGKTVWAEVARD